MTVTIYRSTDASAPTLTGAVGSLIALLDACLINGYGLQSPAGWTKPFENSGYKGCWRNSPTNGTGFYFYADDSGTGYAGAREARCCGFQTMSALGVGTFQFPTYQQLAIGSGAVICRKSATADSKARNWTLIADNTVFYLFVETGDYINPTMCMAMLFGDFFSYAPTDPSRCMIVGRNVENNNAAYVEWSATLNGPGGGYGTLGSTIPGHYLAGNFTGVGGSMPFGKHTDSVKQGLGGYNGGTGSAQNGNWDQKNEAILGSNPWLPSAFPYPNPVDNGFWMAPVWIHHTNCVRGYFKGFWCSLHHMAMSHGDVFNGTGTMAGKTFIALNGMGWGSNNSAQPGQFVIEISNTWS